ncbi:peptide-methionine [Sesbania bispinosa]|nr:peptide-methionine [Sesbania bispinosa]
MVAATAAVPLAACREGRAAMGGGVATEDRAVVRGEEARAARDGESQPCAVKRGRELWAVEERFATVEALRTAVSGFASGTRGCARWLPR